MAVVLNSLLAALYLYPAIAGEEEDNKGMEIKFYEDFTGKITNGSKFVHFNYTFTEPTPASV